MASDGDETSPTLGEMINQVRAAAKDGRRLHIGFPPDFTNTPFIAIAHKIATNSIDEFLAVERSVLMTEEQHSKCCRMIERRVAMLVYSLTAPGPRAWDYPIGDPPPYNWRSTPELLAYMGTDGSKWAEEFCKIAKDHGQDLDEGWVIGWFANAIEAGREVGRRDPDRPANQASKALRG